MSTGEPEPAPLDWEDEDGGREVDDGIEAAAAVLQGEPLVILRSHSADAQVEKVNALRAALHGRPIRVLRLDGKHPRGLAPLASPEPEADRAVLVVEHADTLDPATLEALRDVETLQLVLFHRANGRPPTWDGGLKSASVRFPPGHLIAFELDPKRRRWRTLAAWAVLAVAGGGVLLAGVLYYELRGQPREAATTAATMQDASPPPQAATPPPAPVAPPAPASARTAEPAGKSEPAPPQVAGAISQSPGDAPASAQPSPVVGAQTDASGPPVAALDHASPGASEPPTAPAATDLAPSPEPPAGEAPPASAPARSQPPSHAVQRAQLKRDFERFLAADRNLPKHLTRSQRRALFDKFLDWRASQESSAAR